MLRMSLFCVQDQPKESCCGLGSCNALIVSYNFPDIGLPSVLGLSAVLLLA